jgi:hypothetical protein
MESHALDVAPVGEGLAVGLLGVLHGG